MYSYPTSSRNPQPHILPPHFLLYDPSSPFMHRASYSDDASSLKVLNLAVNKIEKLPFHFGEGTPDLSLLNLSLNKLEKLPPNFCSLHALESLDIHFNHLQGLPENFGQLTRLERLNLSDNFADFQRLPESMGGLVSLTHLDLRNNQLIQLPVEMGRLTALEKIELDGNPLISPPREVAEKAGTYGVKLYLAAALRQKQQQEQGGGAAAGAGASGLPYFLIGSDWNECFNNLVGDWGLMAWIQSLLSNANMPALLAAGAAGSSGGNNLSGSSNGYGLQVVHKRGAGPEESEMALMEGEGKRVRVGGDGEEEVGLPVSSGGVGSGYGSAGADAADIV